MLSFTANDEHNTTMMVDENSNVSLSCEAAGRPTPSMILTSDSTSRELSRILEDDLQPSDRTGKIVFVMHDMQCENSGTYRCEADNRAGQDNRTLKLFVPCKYWAKLVYNISTSLALTHYQCAKCTVCKIKHYKCK